MIICQYLHTVDNKSRVFVPAKFRSELQGELVVVQSMDKCLVLYNKEQWNAFIAKLEAFGDTKMKNIKRYILSSAFSTELDSQGRIVLCQGHREYAEIDKEVSFVGLNSYVEIWKPENFTETAEKFNLDEMKELLENVGF